ncbi:MAG TPA: cell wall hydrolase [Pseudolabrys sp.]|nr:cell wall hydrolase [Pseudolabrys sp.]
MSVDWGRPRGRRGRFASIVFGALAFALVPSAIGFQDLGALLARQPAVAERWREHLIASPFGTIHAATFSLPNPLGTGIPHPPIYALANYDPMDITGAIGAERLGDADAPLQFPKVNRRDKRDSLIARAREPMPPLPPLLSIPPLPEAEVDASLQRDAINDRFDPYSDYEFAAAPDAVATTPPAAAKELPFAQPASTPSASAGKDAARIFFGTSPLASDEERIEPWSAGHAPVVLASADPTIRPSELGADDGHESGESYANKGEVTGTDKRPLTPAERLGLSGEARAKSEKCLANAVYFEARGEPVRGQIAVAQVVMNRVFSPFYPKTVCDVVYQNADRRNACQFTFACDGIPDVVTEPEAWARAKRIARDTLDGKLWLPEVAKSTHYHAYWVHPSWVAEMKKMYKLGVHTFYRPRNWGDGSDEPHWGDPKTTAAETRKLDKM